MGSFPAASRRDGEASDRRPEAPSRCGFHQRSRFEGISHQVEVELSRILVFIHESSIPDRAWCCDSEIRSILISSSERTSKSSGCRVSIRNVGRRSARTSICRRNRLLFLRGELQCEHLAADARGQSGGKFERNAALDSGDRRIHELLLCLGVAGTLIPLGRGGPINVPSRLKLKLSVTNESFDLAGGFQHARIAAPTSSIVLSGAAMTTLR